MQLIGLNLSRSYFVFFTLNSSVFLKSLLLFFGNHASAKRGFLDVSVANFSNAVSLLDFRVVKDPDFSALRYESLFPYISFRACFWRSSITCEVSSLIRVW